jgi:hypothetical protein
MKRLVSKRAERERVYRALKINRVDDFISPLVSLQHLDLADPLHQRMFGYYTRDGYVNMFAWTDCGKIGYDVGVFKLVELKRIIRDLTREYETHCKQTAKGK